MLVSRFASRRLWLLGVCGFAAAMLMAASSWRSIGADEPRSKAEAKSDKASELKSSIQLETLSHWVTSVAFSPDGKRLAIGTHNEVLWFDLAEKKQTAAWPTGTGYVRSLAFLPGGSKLAVGGYQSASVWDVASGSKERDLPKHRGFVTSMAVSPDGKLLGTACDDEIARVIRIDDGALLHTFEHDGQPVLGIAFSPDGKLIATAAGDDTRVTKPGTARLFNVETGKLVATFDGISKAALTIAFVANGKQLLVTSLDEKAYRIDIESGNPLALFNGHSRPINSVAISRDGQLAISGSGGRAKGKNELIVWQIESGKVLGVGDEHGAKIVAVALSPDGQAVATTGYDNCVRLWDVGFLNSTTSDAVTTALLVDGTKPNQTKSADTALAAADNNDPKNAAGLEPKVLKAGIIGLDTSHAIAFAATLNAEKQKPEAVGWRMVAAYPKGSPDIKSSVERVPEYIEKITKLGVEIVDSIDELVKRVDFVMLETNDGRPHFEQLIPVLKAGKPCFIDKPIAGSLSDAIAIFEASKKYKVPVFSSSSLRFGKNTLAVRAGTMGKVTRAETSSPASLEATHPDLFWYGIHGVESLFTVMGTGCVSVKRGTTPEGKIEVVGQWAGDRVGTYREGGKYEGKAVGEKGEAPVGSYDGYDPLLFAMLTFFKTGESPVSEAETLEIYAFMEAADESKRQNGASVTLTSVMEKARAEAAKKIADLK